MNNMNYTLATVVIPHIMNNNYMNLKESIPLFFNTYEVIFRTENHKERNDYIHMFIAGINDICRKYNLLLRKMIGEYTDGIGDKCIEVIADNYQNDMFLTTISVEYIIVMLLKCSTATISLLKKIIAKFRVVHYNNINIQIDQINNFSLFDYLCDNSVEFKNNMKQDFCMIGEYYYHSTAPKNNNLNVLKCLIKHFDITYENRYIHIQACKTAIIEGNLKVLEYLINTFQLNRVEILTERIGMVREFIYPQTGKPINIFRLAAKHGQLHILQWIFDKFELNIYYIRKYNIFKFAAEKGYLAILQWMFDKFRSEDQTTINRYIEQRGTWNFEKDVFELTVRKNSLSCFVQWMIKVDYFYIQETYKFMFDLVGKYGYIHVFNWMLDKLDLTAQDIITNKNEAFEDAAINGHIHVLQWLIDKFGSNDLDPRAISIKAFRKAAEYGRLNVLQWMTDKFNLTAQDVRSKNNNAFRKASEYGRLEVLEWMTDKFNLDTEDARSKNNYAFRKAAMDGHLEVLEWMTNKFDLDLEDVISKDNQAFRKAAKYDNKDILKWMTNKFDLDIEDARSKNNYAFREASRNGHAHILKWMTKRFSLDAYDARSGDNQAFKVPSYNNYLGILI